jgi:hypothetical protein
MKREERYEMMRRLVSEQEISGELQHDFCHSRGISLSVFRYWKRKIKEEVSAGEKPSGTASNFLPVFSSGGSSFSSGVEICYPNGVLLRLSKYREDELIRLLSLPVR